MTDSETNLRTLRLRLGKEASLRREESEEAKEEKKTTILVLEERVEELEQDNRALAFELKEALRVSGDQNEPMLPLEGKNEKDEMLLESRLANLEDRMEVRASSYLEFWEVKVKTPF